MSDIPQWLIDRIKKFEGTRGANKPYWDYKQWSGAYGTRAKGPNDRYGLAEAERRLAQELRPKWDRINSILPENAPPGMREALASLSYNAGTGWTSKGLGRAVRSGDWGTAKRIFSQYNKAGGARLPGLVSRRNSELAWIGKPPQSGAYAVAAASEFSKPEMNAMADAVLPPPFPNTKVADVGGFAPQQSAQAQPKPQENFIIGSSKPLFDAANRQMRETGLNPASTPGYSRVAMDAPVKPPPQPQGQLNPGYKPYEIKPIGELPLTGNIKMQDEMIGRLQRDFTPTNPNDPMSAPAYQQTMQAPLKPVDPSAFKPPQPQGDSLLRPGGATSQIASPRATSGGDPNIMGPQPAVQSPAPVQTPQPPTDVVGQIHAMVPPPVRFDPPTPPPLPAPNPAPNNPAPSGGSGGAGTLVAGGPSPSATSGPKGGFSPGGMFGGLASIAQSLAAPQQQAEQINSQAIRQAEQQGQQMMMEDAQQRQMLAQRTQAMGQYNNQREQYQKQMDEWRRQQLGAFGQLGTFGRIV